MRLTGLEAEGVDGDDAEQDALYDEAVQFVTEKHVKLQYLPFSVASKSAITAQRAWWKQWKVPVWLPLWALTVPVKC